MIEPDELRNTAVPSGALRRRGRPPSPVRMERIDTRIPPDVYDDLCCDALRRGLPVAAVFRDALLAYRRRLIFRR
jgi:hypothetical protein